MTCRKVITKIKIRFQEILALIIVIPFLTFTVLVLFGEKDMEILRIYIPLVSIILGGYFGQGAIREWKGKEIESPVEQREYEYPEPLPGEYPKEPPI